MPKPLGFLLLTILTAEISFAQRVEFTNINPSEAPNGYIKLEWDSGGDHQYILQQDTSILFEHPKEIYNGPDKASFISGLENGTYFYRIKVPQSSWSEVIKVTVEHQSMQLALWLSSIGFIVFSLTALVIIKGNSEHPTT